MYNIILYMRFLQICWRSFVGFFYIKCGQMVIPTFVSSKTWTLHPTHWFRKCDISIYSTCVWELKKCVIEFWNCLEILCRRRGRIEIRDTMQIPIIYPTLYAINKLIIYKIIIDKLLKKSHNLQTKSTIKLFISKAMIDIRLKEKCTLQSVCNKEVVH